MHFKCIKTTSRADILMRSTIRVSRRLMCFFSVSTLRRCSLAAKTTQLVLIPVPVCAVVPRKMCDDQHEQVEQTETTDVQKKTPKLLFHISYYFGTN